MTTLHPKKAIGRSLWRFGFLLIPLMFVCLSFTPIARAVSPPPDGGYPGGNTAEGQNALFTLTSGGYNTAVGFFSLRGDTTGSFNTAMGAGTLFVNTADENTATGAGALLSNTTGTANTANGAFALFSNTTGGSNTAIGVNALLRNATADRNTAVGALALSSDTAGDRNTAVGALALLGNTSGASNIALGGQALVDNSTGSGNTAIGFGALANNTVGDSNTALGGDAGDGVTTASNVICIDAYGANVSNSCFIGHIRGITTANADAIPVLIDSVGQLGTMSSSRRFKKEIKPMEKASEALLALKPVTFHYKSDNTNRPQFGLIAEDVAEVSPDLVVRDEKGEIYTVRYEAVNAMLLNEFLKQHRTVQALESIVAKQEAIGARQQKQIEALTAGLQKVSAQLEVSKPAPHMVNNNQ